MDQARPSTRPVTISRSSGLLRQLGVVSATAIVVSNMVGTGIFTTTGFLASDLGSPAVVLWIWVVGALCALAGAMCYSELGINFPSSGGEYVYLTKAFGPTWGFMSGWVSFFAGFSAPIAAAALAFSDYLGYFFPDLKQSALAAEFGPSWFRLHWGGAQFAASALIIVLTLINCLGVRRVATLQNALTAGKILVLVSFIVLGFAVGRGDWQNFGLSAVRGTDTSLPAQFAISLFFIYTSYSGWNAATYIAEELRQPSRTLPTALLFGTVLVAALYVGLNAVFIYSIPLESLKGVIAVGSVTALALFGPQVAGVFSGLMALSLVATVNAMVTIGPRVYYAMARNGAFLSVAGQVNRRFHTPVAAIVCQGICSVLMTLTPFPSLLLYIGFTLNFFAVASVAALLVFRRTRPNWQKLRAVSFAYPLTPVLFLLVGVWITIYGMLLEPKVSFAAVLTVATGAALYHARWKREPGHQPA